MSQLNEKELLRLLKSWKIWIINLIKYHPKITKGSTWGKRDESAYQQIKALIKILFAKEISEGPIKKDIPRLDLIEWLQGLNQAATAMEDHYVMKATTQLIEAIQKSVVTAEFIEKRAKKMANIITSFRMPGSSTNWLADPIERCKDFIRRLLEEAQGMGEDWLPTPENINALPEKED